MYYKSKNKNVGMQTKFGVSVIIVSHNAEKYIKKLVESILIQKYIIQIILVDNNSKDRTIKIAEEFKNKIQKIEFKILKTKKNIGYPNSLNLGIKEAKGNFILTLNDDTYLEKDFIEKAIKGFMNNDNVGFVSGKILRIDKKTIDSAGQFLSLALYPKERGYGKIDNGRFNSPTPIFSVCGAVALYSKKFLEDVKIGEGEYFDKDYFLYFDDSDICWRGSIKGWTGMYIPEAISYHERSSTSGAIKKRLLFFKRPSFIKYHYIKNRYSNLIKNSSIKQIILHFPFILLRDSALFILTLLSSPKAIYMLIKNISFIKKMYKKRKIIWG